MAWWQWGDAAAPHVVVCAHGLSRQGRDFDVLAQALLARAAGLGQPLSVICPDVVGRGESDLAQGPDGLPVPYLRGRHAGHAGAAPCPGTGRHVGLGGHQHGRHHRHVAGGPARSAAAGAHPPAGAQRCRPGDRLEGAGTHRPVPRQERQFPHGGSRRCRDARHLRRLRPAHRRGMAGAVAPHAAAGWPGRLAPALRPGHRRALRRRDGGVVRAGRSAAVAALRPGDGRDAGAARRRFRSAVGRHRRRHAHTRPAPARGLVCRRGPCAHAGGCRPGGRGA